MSEHEAGELLLLTARVNVDTRSRFYEEREPIADTIFAGVAREDLRGELFRHGQSEYGRCVGKMYQDKRVDGKRWETIHIGYVFLKREPYSDDAGTYPCETWLSLERVVEPAHPTVVTSVAL